MSATAHAELLKLDRDFSSNGTLSLQGARRIDALSLAGSIELKNQRSAVRVLLVDATGAEYQVLSTNYLLAPSSHYDFSEPSEDDLPPGITPVALRIELIDAALRIDSVNTTETASGGAALAVLRPPVEERMLAQIERINRNLEASGALWRAGLSSVSTLSYEQKKRLFGGVVPELYGFEHYAGGIFEMPTGPTSVRQLGTAGSSYANAFSWTARHGQDWTTKAKNQRVEQCGSCWAFGPVGATEVLTNLYFNQHLDLDLSEQQVVNCSKSGSCAMGGSQEGVLKFIQSNGVVDESCDPYEAVDKACGICATPADTIRIGGTEAGGKKVTSDDEIKAMIIKGPVVVGIDDWNHVVSFVGYRVVAAGDTLALHHYDFKAVPADSPTIGKTAWLVKNSFGTQWGQNGFGYIVADLGQLFPQVIKGPVKSTKLTDADIVCQDVDKDGFCNWGIGPKPATCPATCASLADGDDSNAALGPMDEYGNMAQNPATGAGGSPSSGGSPGGGSPGGGALGGTGPSGSTAAGAGGAAPGSGGTPGGSASSSPGSSAGSGGAASPVSNPPRPVNESDSPAVSAGCSLRGGAFPSPSSGSGVLLALLLGLARRSRRVVRDTARS